MKFEEYFINNLDYDFKEFYIDYSKLKYQINDLIIFNRPDCEKIFSKELDTQWNKYYSFIGEKINDILKKDISKLSILQY